MILFKEVQNWVVNGEFSTVFKLLKQTNGVALGATVILAVLKAAGFISISWLLVFLVFAAIIIPFVISYIYLGIFAFKYMKAMEAYDALVEETKNDPIEELRVPSREKIQELKEKGEWKTD